MPLSQKYVNAAVTAVLAVNSYPISRVQAALPRMRDAKLLDPAHTASLDIGVLTVALYNAGYDRGMLTSRLAERLQALMKAIASGALDAVETLVDAGRRDEAIALLRQVPGIGPKVGEATLRLAATNVSA